MRYFISFNAIKKHIKRTDSFNGMCALNTDGLIKTFEDVEKLADRIKDWKNYDDVIILNWKELDG